MNQYTVVNILDLLEAVGEDEVKNALSDFSCAVDPEIEFAKRKMSITHKPSNVSNDLLSKTSQKKLAMHARLDTTIQAYGVV